DLRNGRTDSPRPGATSRRHGGVAPGAAPMTSSTVEAKAAPAAVNEAPADHLARECQRLLATDLDKLNFGCGDHPLPGWVNIDGGDGAWYTAPARRDVIALDLF